MKETSDDEGLSLSKGEEGRYCTGQEYLDWRLEADGGELIRALSFNPALSATATAHRQPYQTQFNAQRSVFSVFEYENLMHRSQLSMLRSCISMPWRLPLTHNNST